MRSPFLFDFWRKNLIMTQLKFNTPDLAGFPDMYGELAILYEDTLGGVHDGEASSLWTIWTAGI